MILVTGGTGQLATALAASAPADTGVRLVGRPGFDFDHPDTIRRTFDEVAPEAVVNAAAYTAVDRAETERDAAFRANRDGPALLARLCATAAIPLIHVSTDYVYDGDKGAPYTEEDRTAPTGVYGETKLAGEALALAANPRTVVLRTAWVFSPTGRNFVRTMLGAQERGVALRVVADQHGSPTAAADLADAIWAVLRRGVTVHTAGVFHAANSGFATWHEFAVAIFRHAARHGRAEPHVAAIATEDWPTPARRPADSRLDCGKLARVFGHTLPSWDTALGRTVDELLGPRPLGAPPRG